MLDALEITRLHDEATLRWHGTEPWPDPRNFAPTPLIRLAINNHRANFDLWHEEDKAREPEASDTHIAAIKRSIDALNQQRNDFEEAIDRFLLTLAGEQNCDAPLLSETPGLIIDRLSILALKIYHTAEEAHRESATEAHRQRNIERLALLTQQRNDLANCLNLLWNEVLHGERRFKLYRQMKMYNDPELNPSVYSHASNPKPS